MEQRDRTVPRDGRRHRAIGAGEAAEHTIERLVFQQDKHDVLDRGARPVDHRQRRRDDRVGRTCAVRMRSLRSPSSSPYPSGTRPRQSCTTVSGPAERLLYWTMVEEEKKKTTRRHKGKR